VSEPGWRIEKKTRRAYIWGSHPDGRKRWEAREYLYYFRPERGNGSHERKETLQILLTRTRVEGNKEDWIRGFSAPDEAHKEGKNVVKTI